MQQEKRNKFLTRILQVYRVVVYNEHLEEKASLVLSPINLILFFSILISITFILAYVLIAYTPIKETIPGLNNSAGGEYEEMYKLERRADSLEEGIHQRDIQLKSLKAIISGDSATSMLDGQAKGGNSAFQFAQFRGKRKTIQNSFIPEKLPLMFPPATGYITERFEPTTEHYAIDIVTAYNAPVKATLDGTVIFSEWSAGTGNVLVLQHASNLISIYKHNSVLLKKTGNFVYAGDVIALVGNSGELTTGPHLHFELWSKGSPLNPEEYVSF